MTRKSVWKHQSYLSRNGNGTPFNLIPSYQKEKYEKTKTYLTNGQVPGINGSSQDFCKTNVGPPCSKSGSSTAQWFQRSKSLLCLPTLSSFPSCESFPFSEPPQFYRNEPQTFQMPVWRSSPRINIDDLEGAQETDVDTGMKLSSSDLSVMSAYSPLDDLSSDLEPSLPSHGEGGPTVKHKLCELSYESFHSVSERSSCSLISSVLPNISSSTSLTELKKDNESHCRNAVEISKQGTEPGGTEEEEFYI